VLMPTPEDNLESRTRLAAFQQALQQLGWIDGHNERIDYRWSTGQPDEIRKNAVELVALAPEVIFASGSAAAGPLCKSAACPGCVRDREPHASFRQLTMVFRRHGTMAASSTFHNLNCQKRVQISLMAARGNSPVHGTPVRR